MFGINLALRGARAGLVSFVTIFTWSTILNIKKLLTAFFLLSLFSFSVACGEVPEATDSGIDIAQEEYESLAHEEFEIDIDALIELDEETRKHDSKADVAMTGMVVIASRNLGNVVQGVRTVEIARGMFAVARWALVGVQVAALVNPVVIAGVLIAGAVGVAIWYANEQAALAKRRGGGQSGAGRNGHREKFKTWNGVTKRITCSEQKYNQMYNHYKLVCNLRSSCFRGMSCSLASEFMDRARRCAAERRNFNNVCFRGSSDPGHDTALIEAENNVANCRDRLAVSCRSW